MRQILLVLLLAAPASARPTPEMDALLMEGIDALFRMEFDAADAAAAKAIALQPDYPHPYLGRAATEMIRFTYGTEASDPSQLGVFQKKVDEVVEISEAWLKKHPGDAHVLLVLGSAHGITSRLALVRRQWLSAFTHGRKAMKSVRAALEAEPELWDAYLGAGMFDFYVDTIPRFAGWLAKIVLGGDRKRGLEAIRIAAEKGRYAKTAAQMILVEIYTEDDYGARNPPEALRLMRGVWARYPGSSMIHSALIVALHEAGEHREAAAESEEYLRRVAAGKYPAMNRSKGHALLGTALWAAGERERALEQFQAGAQSAPGALRTRWALWSRIRAGQILDALGRREEAVAAYEAALAERKLWDFKDYVKPCLSKPCALETPARFSPPY